MVKSLRFAALLATIAVFCLGSVPAAAQSVMHVDAVRLGSRAAGHLGVVPDPCFDKAYKLIGGTWRNGSYSWSFNGSSVPRSLNRAAVRQTIIRSFHNLTSEHNDCGRPTSVAIQATYLGSTKRGANCNSRDGANVVAFGRLPSGVLAVTCYWTSRGHIVEADMVINSGESWALSLQGCREQVMLESTVTHEAGHVFGLGHVSERRHGRLTMSPYIDGVCENQEATLGWGDIRGLNALY